MGLVDIDSQLDNFELLVDSVIRHVKEASENLLEKIKSDLMNEPIDTLYAQAIDIPLDGLTEIKVNK